MTPWLVDQGMTDAVFDGDHFTAVLKADYRIEATIHGSEVIATEIQVGTDAGAQTYRGSLHRVKIADKWEREEISLKGDWGPFFVSFVRHLRVAAPAKP